MTIPVLFLDDASRHVGFADRALAEQLALALLSTLKGLRKLNKRFALNTSVPIAQHQVTDNWNLQLLLGGTAFREEWDFIRQLNNRSPISADIEEILRQQLDNMECSTRDGNVKSIALAWASLLDSATISYEVQRDWSNPWVDAHFTVLEDDCTFTDFESKVRNISKSLHLNEHTDWVKRLGFSTAPSVTEIWNERVERYPRLRFLSRTRKDLVSLEATGAPFLQALSAIEALSTDADNWKNDCVWPSFSTYASPESAQRSQLCWVNDEVSDVKRCFNWHTRFTGSFAGRVHFFVDEPSHQIVIAYIGAKLRNKIVS